MDTKELINSCSDEKQHGFVIFMKIMGCSAGEMRQKLLKHLKGKALNKRKVERMVTDMSQARTDLKDVLGGAHRIIPEKDQRIEQIKICLKDSRAWSLTVLSSKFDIPRASLWRVLSEVLGHSKKLGKIVPHVLTEDRSKRDLIVVTIIWFA